MVAVAGLAIQVADGFVTEDLVVVMLEFEHFSGGDVVEPLLREVSNFDSPDHILEVAHGGALVIVDEVGEFGEVSVLVGSSTRTVEAGVPFGHQFFVVLLRVQIILRDNRAGYQVLLSIDFSIFGQLKHLLLILILAILTGFLR